MLRVCPVVIVLLSVCFACATGQLLAFTPTSFSASRHKDWRGRTCPSFSNSLARAGTSSLGVIEGRDEESVRAGDILSDLSTPTLLIELSLAEYALGNAATCLDDFLRNCGHDDDALSLLERSIFVHTRVTDTSVRDDISRNLGSGKSPVIGRVDACSRKHVPGGAFLGIGLSNHHVGGYYWARGMGSGASLEAHGVAFRRVAAAAFPAGDGGELYWAGRGTDPAADAGAAVSRGATTGASSNSNDGKRSEWADFLVHGDAVQLVPRDAPRVLRDADFRRLVGVRRAGRPLGADPVVERVWTRAAPREEGGGSSHRLWTPVQGRDLL